MYRPLETDPAVTVSLPVQAREHLELEVFISTRLCSYVSSQGVESTLQYRANDGRKRRDLAGDGIPLDLFSNLHC